jgi:hypothetical protein
VVSEVLLSGAVETLFAGINHAIDNRTVPNGSFYPYRFQKTG